MGSDGHTASLFSNLNRNEGLVTFIKDSPKPPSERVTLTLNTINQAKYKIVVITSENKSILIKDILKNKNKNYSISQVKNLVWFLDKEAAKDLCQCDS